VEFLELLIQATEPYVLLEAEQTQLLLVKPRLLEVVDQVPRHLLEQVLRVVVLAGQAAAAVLLQGPVELLHQVKVLLVGLEIPVQLTAAAVAGQQPLAATHLILGLVVVAVMVVRVVPQPTYIANGQL
jgi:hypothetical protein